MTKQELIRELQALADGHWKMVSQRLSFTSEERLEHARQAAKIETTIARLEQTTD